jgi:hypothetical protein
MSLRRITCLPTTRQFRCSIPVVAGPRRVGFGVYARDQRPWGGTAAPAAVYVFAPDRKGERPASHLEHFSGVLHVDGYYRWAESQYDRLAGLAAECGGTKLAASKVSPTFLAGWIILKLGCS